MHRLQRNVESFYPTFVLSDVALIVHIHAKLLRQCRTRDFVACICRVSVLGFTSAHPAAQIDLLESFVLP